MGGEKGGKVMTDDVQYDVVHGIDYYNPARVGLPISLEMAVWLPERLERIIIWILAVRRSRSR